MDLQCEVMAAGTRIRSRWSNVPGEGLCAVCLLAMVFSVSVY